MFGALKHGWQAVTVAWMSRVVKLATGGKLDAEYLRRSTHVSAVDAATAFATFEKFWEAELNESEKSGRKASLLRALRKAHTPALLRAAAFKLAWGALLILAAAFFVREILAWLKAYGEGTISEKTKGWILSAFFFVCCSLLSVALQQMSHISSAVGMRIRAALATAVYRKALVVDMNDHNMDVLSLIATDCSRLQSAASSINYLWSGVAEAMGIIGVLIGFVGVPALPGLGLLLLLLPFQYAMGLLGARLRRRTVHASEKRVRLMDEVLRSAKLVKCYAWEDSFAALVARYRSDETSVQRFSAVTKSINLMVVFALPPMIALLIFGVLTVSSRLDGVTAFTTLSLFNTLRLPLIILPICLRATVEGISALHRIESFLLIPNRTGDTTKLAAGDAPGAAAVKAAMDAAGVGVAESATGTGSTDTASAEPTAAAAPAAAAQVSATLPVIPTRVRGAVPEVVMDHASFTFGEPTTHAPLLTNLNLNIAPGELVMVCGPVSSGKSNLLHAIMGNMNVTDGRIRVGGRFGYVMQSPWCQFGTVRDNIVFGQPWDEARYRSVVHACSLTTDFEIMQDGDMTEIGERGVNVSGGQKARISIARCAYSDADLFLLDSPLSAVDNFVAQHIFKHLFKSLLRGKTIVLVTHALDLLPQADKVVIMRDGGIAYAGPYMPSLLTEHFGGVAQPIPDTDVVLERAVTDGNAAASITPARNSTRRPSSALASPTLAPSGSGAATSPSPAHGATSASGGVSTMPLPPPVDDDAAVARVFSKRADLIKALDEAGALDPAGGAIVKQPSMRASTSAHGTLNSVLATLSNNPVASHLSLQLPKTSTQGGGLAAAVAELLQAEEAASAARAAVPTVARPKTLDVEVDGSAAESRKAAASMPPMGVPQTTDPSRPVRPRRNEGAYNGYRVLFSTIGLTVMAFSVLIFVGTQLTRIFADIWISSWVTNKYKQAQSWYVLVYMGYVLLFIFLLFMRGFVFYYFFRRGASKMHNSMFSAILRAPLSWFTVTPIGRVLSTFSSDQDNVDEALPDAILMVIVDIMILGTTIGLVVRVLPFFAVVAAVLFLAFAYYFKVYIKASRVIKSSAGDSFSSLVANVSETLQGMNVIRAFGAEGRFAADNLARLQNVQVSEYFLDSLQVWLQFRLDTIGALLVLGVSLLCTALADDLLPSSAGLAISNAFQILLFFSLMVREAAEIDSKIASAERIQQLARVEPEPDLPLTYETCPPQAWPQRGEIVFHNVYMSYAPTLPRVLRGVSFAIRSREKIGVVGRTGSGKSSLIMSLFRLVEIADGSIQIDGLDVKNLNLAQLRSRIAILPQDPVLFEGTLRTNLDPFSRHTDEELLTVADKCYLGELVRSGGVGLALPIAHGGGNMSLGTAQLVCLARALLNRSRILILDEATAALDLETDAAVQRVIRKEFSDRTIITIAHRLDTIIDSDRILVMNAGRVAEFDSPLTLLLNKDSIFRNLCMQTGMNQFENLIAAARRHERAMTAIAMELQAELASYE